MVKGYTSAGKAVLDACETELKQLGVRTILAPKYDNQLQGLLIRGFNLPQTVNTNYHPKYYKRFFRKSQHGPESRYTVIAPSAAVHVIDDNSDLLSIEFSS